MSERTWQIREPLNHDDWEDIDGTDVEDAIETWAERMDGPNDYFISKSGEFTGVDVEVRGPGIDGIANYKVTPNFHTTYTAHASRPLPPPPREGG